MVVEAHALPLHILGQELLVGLLERRQIGAHAGEEVEDELFLLVVRGDHRFHSLRSGCQ